MRMTFTSSFFPSQIAKVLSLASLIKELSGTILFVLGCVDIQTINAHRWEIFSPSILSSIVVNFGIFWVAYTRYIYILYWKNCLCTCSILEKVEIAFIVFSTQSLTLYQIYLYQRISEKLDSKFIVLKFVYTFGWLKCILTSAIQYFFGERLRFSVCV